VKFIAKIKSFLSPEDLTKGNITKNIILFTIPIIISLIFQQIYSLTDAIIAGQNLNANEIAGINDSGAITFIFLDFAFGCTSGFSALTAKAKGANDENSIKKSFSIQIVLGFFIAIILTVISIVFKDLLLSMINVKKDNPVYEPASTYLVVIFIGIIAQLFYNLFSNILRSIGDSITPLIVLISSCLLNIVLDLLFMVTFKWGVFGAALATIISQFICSIACFIYCYKRYSFFHIIIC
jgi:putative MATE family efflux protein